jgi:hypothetical protein
VPLKDTIDGFEEIVEGKLDDLPEQAFYMVGITEARRRRSDVPQGAETKRCAVGPGFAEAGPDKLVILTRRLHGT